MKKYTAAENYILKEIDEKYVSHETGVKVYYYIKYWLAT